MTNRPAPVLEQRPVFGRLFSSREAQVRGPLLLLFCRHPGSATTRSALFDVSERFAELDEAEISVTVVLEGSIEAVRDFVPRYQILFPVLHDPDGGLYRAFDVPAASWLRPPSSVPRALGALRNGRRSLGLARGHVAAGFVLDRGHIATSWVGRSPLDPLPIGELCDVAMGLSRPR